jgi:ABC-type nitrate/sulfonate/bicarbonate transport system substrate-binding protein
VPAENRVGRDDRRYLRQTPPSEPQADRGQAKAFVVGEPHALVAEARFQNPVLFAQALDDLVLLVLEPADEKGHE